MLSQKYVRSKLALYYISININTTETDVYFRRSHSISAGKASIL